MKLLLDQNISRKLVEKLKSLYPDSSHVGLIGMERSTDQEIWECAKQNDFTLVTQDSDFYDLGVLYGFPPKIVWIKTGNVSTENIEKLLIENSEAIKNLHTNKELGCLELY